MNVTYVNLASKLTRVINLTPLCEHVKIVHQTPSFTTVDFLREGADILHVLTLVTPATRWTDARVVTVAMDILARSTVMAGVGQAWVVTVLTVVLERTDRLTLLQLFIQTKYSLLKNGKVLRVQWMIRR